MLTQFGPTHLHLGATKPGRKFTKIESVQRLSVHFNKLQSFSPNLYPCNFYLSTLRYENPLTSLQSHTSDFKQQSLVKRKYFSITNSWFYFTVSIKKTHSWSCFKALIKKTNQSNSIIKRWLEWLTSLTTKHTQTLALSLDFVQYWLCCKTGFLSPFL